MPRDNRARPRQHDRQTDMRSLVRQVFRERAKEPFLTLNLLRQYWAQVVGAELAARTRPHRLDRGTLWIAAPDACWAYELQFFKAELLNSVQTFLESRSVSDLRFLAEGGAAASPGDVPVPEAATGPQPGRAQAMPGQPEAPAASAVVPAAADAPPRPFTRLRQAAGGGRGEPTPREAATQGNAPAAAAPGDPAPEALARAAGSIGDPALRSVFLRSLAKQRQARGQGTAANGADVADEREERRGP